MTPLSSNIAELDHGYTCACEYCRCTNPVSGDGVICTDCALGDHYMAFEDDEEYPKDDEAKLGF